MNSTRDCIDCGEQLDDRVPGGICPTCLLGEVDDFSNDELIAGHEIIREIARGGMGIVYHAVDPEAGRDIALKVLLPHAAARPGMCERFRIEAQAAASFDHSAILPVYRVGETNGLPFMTMKLAESGSLAERGNDFRGKWKKVAELVSTLAEATHFAHSRGVLHRDIKPANILFDADDKVYLADFGLAKVLGADLDLTQSIQFLGTPLYVAPELADGKSGAASVTSDVWSLGAVFHELLTGAPPFESDGLSGLFRAIAEDEPALASQKPEGPKIPRDLRIICLKCLAKEQGERYQSAGALAEDLRLWMENRPILARRAGFPERFIRRLRKNPVLSALAAGLVAAVGVIVGLHLHQVGEDRKSLAESYSREIDLELKTGNFFRREATLEVIEKAAALERSPQLRDHLISALAWPALKVESIATADLSGSNYDLASHRLAILTGEGIEISNRETGEVLLTIPFDAKQYAIVGPFSPDQRFLFLRLRNRMELRDVVTGEVALHVSGVNFSLTEDPSRKRVAFASRGGNIRVVDFSGEKPRLEELGEDSFRLIPKAFSPDGKTLAVKREYTQIPALLLIDSQTGNLIREVEVPLAGNTQRAVYHPDGESLFVGFTGGNIHRIYLNEPVLPAIYRGHSDRVSWLGLLENGRLLVSQSEDETTRIWDTATGESLAVLPWSGDYHGCRGTSENRFFLRKQSELVEGSFTPSSILTNVALPDPSPDYAAPKGDWLIKVSPDGLHLATSAMQNIHFVSTRSWEVAQSFPVVAVFDLGFDYETGNLFAGRTVSIFRYFRQLMSEYQEKAYHYPASTASRVAWAGEDLGVAVSWKQKGIKFRGPKADSPHQLLAGKTIHALTVTRDHQRLLAGTDEGVYLYDLSSGTPVLLREFAGEMVRSLAISEDQKMIIAGAGSCYTCWDLESGEQRWSVPHRLHSKTFRPLALSKEASMVAVALDDESVTLLSTDRGDSLACLRHPNRHRVRAVEMTDDGLHVAVLTTGHLVKVWHLEPLASELKTRGFEVEFLNSRSGGRK